MVEQRIKEWLKVGLLALSIVVVGNLWWNARGLLRDLRTTTANLRDTSAEFKDYWSAQRGVIESEKNQKAIEAALAVGATYQATGRLINTQVIPAVLRQLEAGTRATARLDELAGEGRQLVADTNGQLNGKLLPEITAGVGDINQLTKGLLTLAQGTGASIQEVIGAVNQLVQSGDVAVQVLQQKLADPKLDQLVAESVGLVRHSKGIAANLEEASAELPPITKSARKWQGPLRAAQLISVLASILKPL